MMMPDATPAYVACNDADPKEAAVSDAAQHKTTRGT
jgi:hypothetical protein